MRTHNSKEEGTLAAASGRSAALSAGALPPPPQRSTALDPRALITVLMERMSIVNARKDELALAIHGLADITQQLTHTYAQQRLAIEQLRRRVKALENEAAAGPPSSLQ